MVELLKNRSASGYDNLYVRVDKGSPVQVKMAFFNVKVFRMLLANAKQVEFNGREAVEVSREARGNSGKTVQMNLTGCEVQDDGKGE